MARSSRSTRGKGETSPPELPDTSAWQPRKDAAQTLQGAFLKRCKSIEEVIRKRVEIEKGMNIDNMDSGAGVEDIVREELIELLPKRYSVLPGVINDRDGATGGDFDVIIFNDHWFPAIKSGATAKSRRVHLPVEGVYAVIEVKQSISYLSLDEAMGKLVACSRLNRPRTYANRLVENRDRDACFHGMTNPLYTAVLATGLSQRACMDSLVERFYEINKRLKRSEMVRCLAVLDEGAVSWAFWNGDGQLKPARFMREDLFHPILPAYSRGKRSCALFHLMQDLSLHLYHSVLGAEDIVAAYGAFEMNSKIPASPEIIIRPDPEWLNLLDEMNDGCGEISTRPEIGEKRLSQLHVEVTEEMRLSRYPIRTGS